jgi:hypothetical protein
MALYRFIPLLLLALSAIFPLCGQNAKLSGQVIDPSGAPIINADVHLVSEGTRAELASKTDREGGFVFPSVAPGTYSLRVEAAVSRHFKGDSFGKAPNSA